MADAYAKDHALQGRWAESREELERELEQAMEPQQEPLWKGSLRAAVYGLAAACVPLLVVALWKLNAANEEIALQRQQEVYLLEQNRKLSGEVLYGKDAKANTPDVWSERVPSEPCRWGFCIQLEKEAPKVTTPGVHYVTRERSELVTDSPPSSR
jgi:hypothetical protein